MLYSPVAVTDSMVSMVFKSNEQGFESVFFLIYKIQMYITILCHIVALSEFKEVFETFSCQKMFTYTYGSCCVVLVLQMAPEHSSHFPLCIFVW